MPTDRSMRFYARMLLRREKMEPIPKEELWQDKLNVMRMGLEKHIREYRPEKWYVDRSPCGNIRVSEDDIINFLNCVQESSGKGELEERLGKRLDNYEMDTPDGKFPLSHYDKAAIASYYAEGKYIPILTGDFEAVRRDIFSGKRS